MFDDLVDSCAVALRRLLPPACVLCGARADIDGLCAGCGSALPRLVKPVCRTCAAPIPGGETCGRCLGRAPRFDRVVAALQYAHPADALIRRLKYSGQLACARPLAATLAEALEREPYPDLVLPMPLARERLAERGFNQSLEIARLACREFGLEIRTGLARRVRAGAPQTTLPWKERARNVRGAFACDADLTGLRIAVVDDVLTTGATLDELARVLKRRGAREVVGWMTARTVSTAP